MKKLLIRADDLGFSEAVNYGIEKTVKKGLVKSVGIMTNMPAAKHGVDLLKGTDVCYGQHTNICAGFPLCDPKLIPSLVKENGEFKSSSQYRQSFKEGIDFVNLDEVVLEIEAQYEEFKRLTDEEPKYFEGHAVASNNFFKGLQIVAQRHGLDYLPFAMKPVCFRNSMVRIQMKSMDPDYDPKEFLKEVVDGLSEEYVDVFVAHPGYLDDYILSHSSLTLPRTKEVEALCDKEMIAYLANKDIALVTYAQL